MKVRSAHVRDAAEISIFLQELTDLGQRTLPSDQDFILSNYIEHADNIQCAVAQDDNGALLGLQILKRATEGNTYGMQVGWGIIGTHVRPSAARRGVGKTLFAATKRAAHNGGLRKIDATIGATNASGLAYYDAMGFRTYKTLDGRVCKCFEVDP